MRFRSFIVLVLGGLLTLSTACAHLIVSQRGTINIVGDSVFVVLSLPVSAFNGIDDNADGLLSIAELREHAASIESQIKKSVILENSQGVKPVVGLMLNTVPPENDHNAPAKQIVVLGRYTLEPGSSGLKFTMRMFGKEVDERTEHITVTQGTRSQLMTLSPDRPTGDVLPSAWRSLMEQARLGAEHVLSGADHLLFLLVVLAAGLTLRRTVLALTCFTAGHAITLIACTWFGLSVSPSIVEPAIAATIVGMAWFDRRAGQQGWRYPTIIRLSLVFVCALIHGLGLAGALTDLGLDPIHKAWSLLGFNLGIELAQVGVALVFTLVTYGIKYLRGSEGVAWMTRILSYVAMSLGLFWFAQRIMMVS